MLDDFVKEYLVECQEGLALFESQLLELEKDPTAKPVLSSIFRVVHSIKGSSGFLGFPKMGGVAHEGEELLGKLREGTLTTDPAIVSALLELIDAMRGILASIETGRNEGDRDYSALMARLRDLRSGRPKSGARAVTPPVPEPPPSPVVEDAVRPLDPPASSGTEASVPPVAEARTRPAPRARKPKSVPVVEPPPPVAPVDSVEPSMVAPSMSESTIRVDVGLLDKLMNLVGELVLTRNQILRCSSLRDEAVFQASSQRLNLITTELQEGMMKTRMQPIRNISSKLPRIVRDLALTCGKEATILLEGEDTELDKTISEAIKDPITHIVRNAVDHGIEPPDVRRSRGKPAEGTLRLRAYHEGGMVNIEVADDGNGIDPAKIRKKTLESGRLAEEQTVGWTDREWLGMIFRPGFSTAESLTMVSGRGVGMDVVKSRIESIGGSVDLTSRVGLGTTIKMKIPLTLTIINALIVSAGGDRFAIPQVNLVELIRLRGDAARSGLIDVQGASVCRYRGRLLPLIDLNDVLKIGRSAGHRDDDAANIVVLQADRLRFGLVVDRIDDAQEIVVRPPARQLKGIVFFAGATIMGDGKISLILDVFGLAKGLNGRVEHGTGTPGIEKSLVDPLDEHRALLVLRGTDGGRLAIPLEDVDRLESFPSAMIEWIGGRPVVQYRKTLVPLIDAAARLRGLEWTQPDPSVALEDRTWHVVIHIHQGRRVGVVFDRVLDIVEENLEVRAERNRPGVRLTAAIQGQVTEVIDISYLVDFVDAMSSTLEEGGVL